MPDNDETFDLSLAQREPIRLPMWAATIVGALLSAAIALLLDDSVTWRDVRVEAASFLAAVGPIFAAVEIARGKVVTPARSWLEAVAAERRGQAEGRKRSRATPARKRP